jgi:hypothetical protein
MVTEIDSIPNILTCSHLVPERCWCYWELAAATDYTLMLTGPSVWLNGKIPASILIRAYSTFEAGILIFFFPRAKYARPILPPPPPPPAPFSTRNLPAFTFLFLLFPSLR